ncbi:hedgehog protein [Plakobranchus ocellatus]|uniref:Hedgehog protein n=1 Tax=Plakobranchus ocellatus TaxID=259542 RepID=A0AAV3YWJ3_9GAST|nr:hedgehog protein [Plakobranchus ocellatus]
MRICVGGRGRGVSGGNSGAQNYGKISNNSNSIALKYDADLIRVTSNTIASAETPVTENVGQRQNLEQGIPAGNNVKPIEPDSCKNLSKTTVDDTICYPHHKHHFKCGTLTQHHTKTGSAFNNSKYKTRITNNEIGGVFTNNGIDNKNKNINKNNFQSKKRKDIQIPSQSIFCVPRPSSRTFSPRNNNLFILLLVLLVLLVSLSDACAPRGGSGRRRRVRKLTPLVFKQHVPNVSENTLGASGLTEGAIKRGDPKFKDLVRNYNPDIVFRDEEGNGDDRIMSQSKVLKHPKIKSSTPEEMHYQEETIPLRYMKL